MVLSDGVLRGACPKYLSACPILGPLGVEMLIRNENDDSSDLFNG